MCAVLCVGNAVEEAFTSFKNSRGKARHTEYYDVGRAVLCILYITYTYLYMYMYMYNIKYGRRREGREGTASEQCILNRVKDLTLNPRARFPFCFMHISTYTVDLIYFTFIDKNARCTGKKNKKFKYVLEVFCPPLYLPFGRNFCYLLVVPIVNAMKVVPPAYTQSTITFISNYFSESTRRQGKKYMYISSCTSQVKKLKCTTYTYTYTHTHVPIYFYNIRRLTNIHYVHHLCICICVYVLIVGTIVATTVTLHYII